MNALGKIETVRAFAELNNQADYSDQLKIEFGDINAERLELEATHYDTAANFNEFMNYYFAGLSDDHNPAEFSSAPVVTAPQVGGAVDDTFFGAGGNDYLSGLAGNDRLSSGAGDDTLLGGAGLDFLDGGAGDDRLIGDEGEDVLFGGDGSDLLNGGAGDDTIRGGDTTEDLRDQIFAGAGNDSVDAGAGNDLVYGQDGNDTIAGGFGADDLRGQNGDDVITGSALSDLVYGGAGDDFVNGGFGHDRINGGAGADKFYHLGIADHGSDWLQDYNAAEGDVLLFGNSAASVDDFQVNLTETDSAGEAGVAEAFVIYKPTEQIIWALIDGQSQDEINLKIGSDTFDLLS